MNRRLQHMSIAVAGAIALLVGGLSHHWWSGTASGLADVRIGLRSLDVCLGGHCESADLERVLAGKRALFNFVTALTWFTCLAAPALVAVGVLLRHLQAMTLPLRLAAYGCLAALALAVASAATFPGEAGSGISLGWSFYLTLGGGLVGAVGALSATLDVGFGEGRVYRPLGPAPPPRPAPVATSGVPPTAAPDPADVARQRMEYSRVVAAAARDAVPVNGQRVTKQQRNAGAMRPAAADAAARTLRFVVKELTIVDAGLQALDVDGGTRMVGWTDIAALFVGQLPVDPPFDRTVFLDVIPAGGGAPLRLLPSTRANYGALEGAGTTSQENFRRLAAHARARHAGIAVDEASAGFLRDRTPPRQFAGISQFVEYDTRYPGI